MSLLIEAMHSLLDNFKTTDNCIRNYIQTDRMTWEEKWRCLLKS